jgi:hypothetical protein
VESGAGAAAALIGLALPVIFWATSTPIVLGTRLGNNNMDNGTVGA